MHTWQHSLAWLAVILGGITLAGASPDLAFDIPRPGANAAPLHIGVDLQLTEHYVTWDSREIGLMEEGLAVNVNDQLLLGATLLNSDGHGRDAGNKYRGDGTNKWVGFRLCREGTRLPEFKVIGERTRDEVVISSDNPDFSFYTNPYVRIDGLRVEAQKHHGQTLWHGVAGVYGVYLYEAKQTQVEQIGLSAEQPLRHDWRATLGFTEYWDHYLGRHFSYQAECGLAAPCTKYGTLILQAHLFPRGIPMAGTPFSSASTIGSYFDMSAANQFHTDTMGYLTLAGQVKF